MMISDQLKTAIKQSEMSNWKLAQVAKIDQGVISRFMAGDRDLRLETAAKIANALGMELVPKE
tara:strand:- start:30 stop:218 length:189 start_codon:yes stop_codon:yes gene_type:complete